MLSRENDVRNDIFEYIIFVFIFFTVFMLPVTLWGDEVTFGFIKRSCFIQYLYASYKFFFRVGLYPFYAIFLYCFLKGEYRVIFKAYLAAQTTLFFLLTYPIKVVLGKARPLYGSYYVGFSFSDRFHSFPSGHACDAFCSAAFLFCCFSFHKKAKYFILFYTAFISCTRVILHRHYLSDVAFGGLFGGAVSIMFIYFWILPICQKNTAKT